MNYFLVLLVVSLAIVRAPAQAVGIQAPSFRAMADTLPLDVSVRDAAGRFVAGLERDNFIVTVNGQSADVAVFSVEPRPLSMVVMVDTSMSASSFSVGVETQDRVPYYHSLLRLVAGLGDEDRARIGSFGLRVAINPTWTRDLDDVTRILLEEMWGGGGTPLWQALGEAVSALEHEAGRRVVVVFTDGVDTGNTPAGQGAANEARRHAQEIGVSVYAIRPPNVRGPLADRMKELVSRVGGTTFEPSTVAGVADAVQQLIDELRHQYALGISLRSGTTIRSVTVRTDNDRFVTHLHGPSRRFVDEGRR